MEPSQQAQKVTLEVDARFQAGMMRALAMFEEMEQLALTAPDGHVVHQCEKAVIDKGRRLQAATLEEAVARRRELDLEVGGPLAHGVRGDARLLACVPTFVEVRQVDLRRGDAGDEGCVSSWPCVVGA